MQLMYGFSHSDNPILLQDISLYLIGCSGSLTHPQALSFPHSPGMAAVYHCTSDAPSGGTSFIPGQQSSALLCDIPG